MRKICASLFIVSIFAVFLTSCKSTSHVCDAYTQHLKKKKKSEYIKATASLSKVQIQY